MYIYQSIHMHDVNICTITDTDTNASYKHTDACS